MSFSINSLDIDFQLAVFAAIMERMPGLVAIKEQENGRLIYINDTGVKMLGTDDYAELELLIDQNQLGKGNADFSTVPSGLHEKECQWHNIQGETFLGLYEEIFLRNNSKDYCFFRITDYLTDRRFKQQLNRELERFGALFDYASIGILVTNQWGEIILINDFALNQFGYRREELLGQKVEILIPQRVHTRHEQHRDRYNAHPQSRPMGIGMDLFAVRKDGSEFPVEISLSHYANEEGHFVIAYVNNITERKKAEEKIENLNNELEAKVEERTGQLTQALEQLKISKEELTAALSKEKELGDLKSRFVSMASHEFRTPLSTILSSAFLVKHYAEEKDQPVRNKHIQRIVNAVSLLTDTLNDFLSVGKIEEGKVQVRLSEFDIQDFFNNIIQEMQELAKEKQTISYHHSGETTVLLDPSLLKHITMNLVGNAIKFSKSDSLIEISTTKNDSEFSLIVKDYGIGMSEEDQQHLFERFYRGTNVSNIQGTGLGLHIVNNYSKLMNGSISCRSELNAGTTFIINFQLETKKSPASHENNLIN
ncbi:PAS domain-containing sensor histidine kinase [Chitinophaga sp.]|uniref:sensor histidine kinase n=1 Tax=Chitinophaga sp. TaxID=1869181 RepID=UPI002CA59E2F|nr:PAS domain-containing sensor histidine kinase [Chitinophaga sp.]HWV66421.1 PAS domain-containing sensor histidine kinase [Chitinophaga sp.]